MTILLRFEGLDALPVFGLSRENHQNFITTVQKLVLDGNYVILSVESADDDSIDLTVNDTVLALDVENETSGKSIPADIPEFLNSLRRPDMSLEMVSDKFDTTSTNARRRTIMILAAQSKVRS